jgi:hypothetical protein
MARRSKEEHPRPTKRANDRRKRAAEAPANKSHSLHRISSIGRAKETRSFAAATLQVRTERVCSGYFPFRKNPEVARKNRAPERADGINP